MDKILKPTLRIEPGDGTGQSVADVEARNAKGMCGSLGCDGKITDRSQKYPMVGQLCPCCEKKHEEFLDRVFEECVIGLWSRGRQGNAP